MTQAAPDSIKLPGPPGQVITSPANRRGSRACRISSGCARRRGSAERPSWCTCSRRIIVQSKSQATWLDSGNGSIRRFARNCRDGIRSTSGLRSRSKSRRTSTRCRRLESLAEFVSARRVRSRRASIRSLFVDVCDHQVERIRSYCVHAADEEGRAQGHPRRCREATTRRPAASRQWTDARPAADVQHGTRDE